jgi:ribose/xylose/arabinose/galactoside ABC-type transport system permease subunit
MVAMSSRARAHDYILIGTALGAANGMLTIASRLPLFITTLRMLTVAGER